MKKLNNVYNYACLDGVRLIFLSFICIVFANNILAQTAKSDSIYNEALYSFNNGDFISALNLFEKTLNLDKSEYANHNVLIGLDSQWLAHTLYQLGRIEEAKKYDASFYELLPVNRNDAESILQYSYNTQTSTSPKMAIYWAERCLEEESKLLADEHPYLYGSYCNLANYYLQAGDSIKCRKYIQSAIEQSSKIVTTTTSWKAAPYTTKALLELELKLRNKVDFENSLEVARKYLNGDVTSYPDVYATFFDLYTNYYANNPEIVNNEVNNVVSVLQSLDRDKFISCVNVVRAINTYSLNSKQPKIGLQFQAKVNEWLDESDIVYPYLLFDYARLLYIDGKSNTAIELLTEILSLLGNRSYNNPQDRADVLCILGQCYESIHDYKSSEKVRKDALNIYRKSGEMHQANVVRMLHQLAALSTRTNNFKQAIKYLEDCRKLMIRINAQDPGDFAYICKELGNCYSPIDTVKAIECYIEALNIINKPKSDLEKEVWVDAKLALINLKKDYLDVEQDVLGIADEVCTNSLSTVGLKIKIYNFPCNYFDNSLNFNRSLYYADKVIELTNINESINILQTYLSKCIALVMLNKTDEAWDLAYDVYQATVERYGECSDEEMQVLSSFVIMADHSLSLSYVEDFPEIGENVLEYLKKILPEDPTYLNYSLLAARCYLYSDYDKCKHILEHTLKIVSPSILINDHYSTAAAYYLLSMIERNSGNIDKSLFYCNKCLNSLRQVINVNPSSFIAIYDEMGQTLLMGNRLIDAENAFLKGIKIGEDTNPNLIQLSSIYEHAAQLYNKLGQFSKASNYTAKRNAITCEYSDNQALEASNLLSTLWLKYNSGMREECFNDILSIESFVNKYPNLFGSSLPLKLKANFFLREGIYEEAIENIEKALIGQRDQETLSLATEIYLSSQNYNKAHVYANELLSFVKKFYDADNSLEFVSPYKKLGDVYWGLQDFEKSLSYYQNCFSASVKYFENNFLTLTRKQRTDFWNNNSVFFYSFLPNLAISNSYPTEINGLLYDTALFSNGLLLNADNSISEIVSHCSSEVKALYNNYITKLSIKKRMQESYEIKQGVALSEISLPQNNSSQIKNNRALTILQVECDSIERSLIAEIKDKNSELLNYQTYTWRDIEKKLSKNSAAIEFIDFPTDSINNTIAALILKKGLDVPILKVLYKYHRGKEFSFDELYSTTNMGDTLVNSLAEYLVGCKNVYFAPSGILCSIALESLPRSYSEVISQINLIRVSSTRILAEQPKKNKSYEASLFGGLNYNLSVDSLIKDSQQYPELKERAFVADNLFSNKRDGDVDIEPLPGTLVEVKAIDSLLEKEKMIKPRLLVGDAGTESAFKALSGSYGAILHISTHGFFNADAINTTNNLSEMTFEDLALDNSGLLMAGASHRYIDEFELPNNIDDGILKASEICNLDLRNVNLAVLSACETGLGTMTGDGVFGLQRGFKKAGVNSILMSLWKVDDDATCALMTEFYKNWIEGKSKFEALEIAKNVVKQDPRWSNPKYWASFILLDGID